MPFINVRPEGHFFIALFVVLAIVLFTVAQWLGFIGIVLIGWCIYFFRDPDRVTPLEDGLIISPADGVIQMVGDAALPPELGMGEAPMRRVSIFMNVFDCHVNRIPIDGEIVKNAYRSGKFLNASLDKASEDNERRSLVIRTKKGVKVTFVQIAGLVARRIVCWVDEGQSLRVGERYGMIRFGSRVDVYLPKGTRLIAIPGQRAVAGETPIAQLDNSEEDQEGEWR
ncbi:MAG: phosphatidylserine decarboxylase [Pseudomonadota bacterium]|nr:phosphatidylserine decarboxylase [Pseudomonadota bacterium]